MKKAKKQKLNNIWAKIKKPLMILSIVGNILFLIFIIVGCVGTHKRATQTSAVDTGLTDLTNTKWEFNSTINLNSLPSNFDINFISNNRDFTIITNGWSSNALTYLLVYPDNPDPGDPDYEVNAYQNSTWTSQLYRTIEITSGEDVTRATHIEWLEENAVYVDVDDENEPVIVQRFTFDKYFNYNAPFAMNSNSMFVNSPHTQKIYDLPTFISNGEYFNRIKLYYVDGNGTLYETNSGTSTNANTGTGYYLYMEYINTSTSASVVVNNRASKSDYTSASGSASVQTYLVKGSYWLNDNYRYLGFYDNLTSEQLNYLAQFNSEFDENGFSSATTNVGLGNVFTLISNAFGSFTNIFKIEILPNISIGLLLFLPLIVIVIIVIIKLVKR